MWNCRFTLLECICIECLVNFELLGFCWIYTLVVCFWFEVFTVCAVWFAIMVLIV